MGLLGKITVFFISMFVLLFSYIFLFAYNKMNVDNFDAKLFSNQDCISLNTNHDGTEDIEFFNEEYLITAAGNFHWFYSHIKVDSVPSGEIYLINKNGRENPIKLEMVDYPKDVSFHPHGIFTKNKKFLYVLNHAYNKGGERIDYFEIDVANKKALYKSSMIFENEYNGRINDFVVLDDYNTIIASTWRAFKINKNEPNKFLSIMEFILSLIEIKLNNVLTCGFKENKCKILESFVMSNGVNWNRKDKVYVVDSSQRMVKEFKISFSPNDSSFNGLDLIHTRTINIGFFLDNVIYDEENDKLYLALFATPIKLGNVLQYYEKNQFLPEKNLSQDFTKAVSIAGGAEYDLKTDKLTVLNFNSAITGASTFLRHGDNLFYGSFLENQILICKLKNPAP